MNQNDSFWLCAQRAQLVLFVSPRPEKPALVCNFKGSYVYLQKELANGNSYKLVFVSACFFFLFFFFVIISPPKRDRYRRTKLIYSARKTHLEFPSIFFGLFAAIPRVYFLYLMISPISQDSAHLPAFFWIYNKRTVTFPK